MSIGLIISTFYGASMLIRRLASAFFSGKMKGHFGQFGEDIIIHKMFPKDKSNGVYLDIGSFHPFYFSNTAYLWLKGWSGINVDANPNSVKLFKKSRPSDININAAVVSASLARTRATVPIYVPVDHINAKGTCDTKTAVERGYSHTIEVPAVSIGDLLGQLPRGGVDFLNIDIEGLDEVVVAEFDFEKVRPTVICVEDYSSTIEESLSSSTSTRLASAGYRLEARVGPSSIFRLNVKR